MWRAERLWYDEFLDRILIANSPVREWTDRDDSRAALYMQQEVGMQSITSGLISEAVGIVAEERTRHCVRDWLETLKWDGIDRIDNAFEDHWGADIRIQPFDHVRAASRNFFIGLVARVFKPGCKLDNMVIFEGETGRKKSTALDILGQDWYAASNGSIHGKDFQQSLSGKWIIEWPEVDKALRRYEMAAVKSIVSTRIDRYRPSYGRATKDFPRQCVFAGTTNRSDWGEDETGLRRFWPIRCGEINLASLREAREQMFAEAVTSFRSSATWWEMPDSTINAQADRQSQDVWTERTLRYASTLREIPTDDILEKCLKIEPGKQGKVERDRVGVIMRLIGWELKHVRRDGEQVWRWMRLKDNDEFHA